MTSFRPRIHALPRRIGCLGAAALLAGCAGGPGLVERLTGGRVTGTAEVARVTDMPSRADAFPLAIAHCARFGRDARFLRREGKVQVFRCLD